MDSPSKADLRATLAAARAALAPERQRAAAAAIADRLRVLVAARGPGLRPAAYAALSGEVQTARILQNLQAQAGWVALPVFGDGGTPALVRCEDPAGLVPGLRGVPVPPQPWTPVDPATLDLILVPGLAFDRTGARLGRGGGFYDRLLAGVPARRVALAYEFQVVDAVPTEPHDARVDHIVTEERLYVTRDWRFDRF